MHLFIVVKLIKSFFSHFIYLLVYKLVLLINSNQKNFNQYSNNHHPPLIPPSKGGILNVLPPLKGGILNVLPSLKGGQGG